MSIMAYHTFVMIYNMLMKYVRILKNSVYAFFKPEHTGDIHMSEDFDFIIFDIENQQS